MSISFCLPMVSYYKNGRRQIIMCTKERDTGINDPHRPATKAEWDRRALEIEQDRKVEEEKRKQKEEE
jgi:hypothetical protein